MAKSQRFVFLVVSTLLAALAGTSVAPAASAQTITNDFGSMTIPRVTGETANGGTFTGKFTPKRFVVRDERLKVVGLLNGTLTKRNGDKVRVNDERIQWKVAMAATRAANQAAPGAKRSTMAVCDILTLVLGPLHLDVLGLVIDLNRLVLTITAVSGAGNLLGNLLCAVAGLLDQSALSGLNQILANLLNAVLGILRS